MGAYCTLVSKVTAADGRLHKLHCFAVAISFLAEASSMPKRETEHADTSMVDSVFHQFVSCMARSSSIPLQKNFGIAPDLVRNGIYVENVSFCASSALL